MRLATAGAGGRPRVVPAVFALGDLGAGDVLVTAVDVKPKSGRRLARLRDIAANEAVSALVDAYEEDWERLWWARADGLARIVGEREGDRREERVAALAWLAEKYPQYRGPGRMPQGPLIVITVRRWSGWAARP